MMRLLPLYWLIALPLLSFAQKPELVSPFYERLTISVDSSRTYCIKPRRQFTSFLLKTGNLLNFDKASIIIGKDTISLHQDLHNSTDLQKGTGLIILPQPADSVQLLSGKLKGSITFHFLNAYPENLKKSSFRILQEGYCDEPAVISPRYWRKGLAEPIGTPVETKVGHIIIHHSAAEPTDDFVNDIRNIYLLHTQVNGWDDIGYNFVIAPDGTIFQGRDNKDVCEKDNVQGAHMCGKNSGTMGICLLGNFTDKLPADNCLKSLYMVLAWKASRENMDIYGNSLHPLGGYSTPMPDALLPHIAGHRDGCKPGHTVCPGNTLYPVLKNIKDSTDSYLKLCPALTAMLDEKKSVTKIFPQPAIDRIYIQSEKNWNEAELLDLRGEKVATYTSEGSFLQEFALDNKLTGIYILHIHYSDENSLVEKVIIN